MPIFDFSGVATSFEPLPDGDYRARFEKFEFRPSSRKGNPNYSLTWIVAEDEIEHAGRRLWVTHTMTKDSFWAVHRDLVAMGVDPDVFKDAVDYDALYTSLIGTEAILVAKQSTYQGKQGNQVDEVKSLDYAYASA